VTSRSSAACWATQPSRSTSAGPRTTRSPAIMEHLGGPEDDAQLAARQRRYEGDPRQFKIVVAGEGVGWVGYWEREWGGEQVYEVGWSVLPASQGRGIATAATRLAIDHARAGGGTRLVYAYPPWRTARRTRSAQAGVHAREARRTTCTRRANRSAAATGASTCAHEERAATPHLTEPASATPGRSPALRARRRRARARARRRRRRRPGRRSSARRRRRAPRPARGRWPPAG
jgi:GNAT superfamily N-acetyltransferase